MKKIKQNVNYGSTPSIVYCFGLIGSLFYFIATATGFWIGVLGVLKALIWPAFLVYYLFKFLNV